MTSDLRSRLGELAPTRQSLRLRLLAAGFGGGQHRAERRGSGIEFAGHRQYTPGDDLRHLDRHALLRHGRHLIREFHTETERALWLIVDASPSMLFRSEAAPDSKRGFGLLLAAGLASLARRAGDPVGLTLAGSGDSVSFAPRLGADHFERLLAALESADEAPVTTATSARPLAEELGHAARRAPRGATIVVLSDLLDQDPRLVGELGGLAAQRRSLTVVQVLDPHELSFPFRGPMRFEDSESSLTIDTEAERVRSGYLEALTAHNARIESGVRHRGGEFVRLLSSDPPNKALGRIRLAHSGGESTELSKERPLP